MASPWLSGAAVIGVVVLVVALTTPWKVDASGADGHLDFNPANFAREANFHHLVRPPSYLAMLLAVLVAALLGLTPVGARIITALSAGRWWLGVITGGAVCLVLPRIVSAIAYARSEQVLRQFGLSNQTWGAWLGDQLRGLGLTLALTLPGLLLLVWLARRYTSHWWVIGGLGAIIVTVGISFLYPIVIEPIYNNFRSLEAGDLRSSLLALAAQDGVKVSDVLVADASRRTTALNAYVSGIGSSRRVVLYDTLLAQATPDEIRLVVAHELGHVKHHDVARGTFIGALGALGGIALLAGAMSTPWLRSRANFDGMSDPRSIAAVLAVAAVVTAVVGPAVNLVSRRVEANADLHSLELTRDPATFIDVERRLALANVSSLGGNHLAYHLFATHPSTPERIALARDWARKNGVEVPPPLVGR